MGFLHKKILIFLKEEYLLDACSITAVTEKEHGPVYLDCVTWDKLKAQQWAQELPKCHRGSGRSENPASSHMNVYWL